MLYIVEQGIIMATPMKITQQCGYLFSKAENPTSVGLSALEKGKSTFPGCLAYH